MYTSWLRTGEKTATHIPYRANTVSKVREMNVIATKSVDPT